MRCVVGTTGRRLLLAGLLVAVTAVSGCQSGDTADRPPSEAAPTSTDATTNVEQNSAAGCTLVVTAVGGVSGTALDDARRMAGGQLSREEFGERLGGE